MSLRNVESEVNKALVGRADETRAVLRAAIAQENIFLYGPPGTAKTLLCETFSKAISAKQFIILLSRFSTPEEVFGPNKITKLKTDEYERNLTGRLADCEIALIDEIFKASSAIINTFLRITNERMIENGVRIDGKLNSVKVPLRFAMAASNEFPERGELDALYDRFLIRCNVKYVATGNRSQLLFGKRYSIKPTATVADLDKAHDQAMAIEFSDSAKDAYLAIWNELNKESIEVSDRRAVKAMSVAKAEAWLQGSNKVHPDHLIAVADCFWSSLDNFGKVQNIVFKHSNPEALELAQFSEELDNISRSNLRDGQQRNKAVTRCEFIQRRVKKMAPSRKASVILNACASILDECHCHETGVDPEILRNLRALQENSANSAPPLPVN